MQRLIRPGERSKEAADVQSRLRALGFSVDDEPGHYGEATRAAVREFQQQRRILVDGIVGPNTWSELVEASYQLGDRALYLKHPPIRGDDVLTLQARLNALGFDAGREDGIFGADTDRAVRAFQREYAIAEDGIFGRLSQAALAGLRVDRPTTAAGLREELRRIRTGGVRDATIAIDPGHGGDDRGAEGPDGSFEADLCWDIATRLADRLLGVGGRARLTRVEAENIDASERARRANDLDADVFLSVHLNSTDHSGACGASTYHFPRSHAGQMLAEKVQGELVGIGLPDCRTHPRAYPVLRETRMPAILVEPGFISNADDEKWLNDADARAAVADAIARGLLLYYAAS